MDLLNNRNLLWLALSVYLFFVCQPIWSMSCVGLLGDKKINPKLQKSDFDCGHTCLKMLGYDIRQTVDGRGITTWDISGVPGFKLVRDIVGVDENINYDSPHLWLILGKDKVVGARHWVIRYKDKVYCPTLGEVDAKTYKEKYVAYVLNVYIAPFNERGVLVDLNTALDTRHIKARESAPSVQPKLSVGETITLKPYTWVHVNGWNKTISGRVDVQFTIQHFNSDGSISGILFVPSKYGGRGETILSSGTYDATVKVRKDGVSFLN